MFESSHISFEAVRMHPKPSNGASIPIVLGGNSDSALRRVAAWADGWYGFNLDGTAHVAERLMFLPAACRSNGRDIADLRCSIALRDPEPAFANGLSDLGVDELVLVDSPPADPGQAADWVSTLADRWLS